MNTEDVKPGVKVRVLENPYNAYVFEGYKECLKPGDVVVLTGDFYTTFNAADNPCVLYERLDSPNFLPLKCVELLTDAATPQKHTCTCPILTVLHFGCQCGGI